MQPTRRFNFYSSALVVASLVLLFGAGSKTVQAACALNCDNCDTAGDGACDVCGPNFGVLNQTTGPSPICGECASQCITCQKSGAGKCDECVPGFAVAANGLCTRCSSNCQNCSVSTLTSATPVCDICNNRYTLEAATKTCAACDPNCANGCDIAKAGKCDSNCAAGYTLQNGNCIATCDPNCATNCSTPNTCLGPCQSGWALNTTTKTCQKCDPNCGVAGCDAPATCKPGGCNESYGSLDSMCAPCSDNCANCTNRGGQCEICNEGYWLNTENAANWTCELITTTVPTTTVTTTTVAMTTNTASTVSSSDSTGTIGTGTSDVPTGSGASVDPSASTVSGDSTVSTVSGGDSSATTVSGGSDSTATGVVSSATTVSGDGTNSNSTASTGVDEGKKTAAIAVGCIFTALILALGAALYFGLPKWCGPPGLARAAATRVAAPPAPIREVVRYVVRDAPVQAVQPQPPPTRIITRAVEPTYVEYDRGYNRF